MRILCRQAAELLFHTFRNDTVLIFKYKVIASDDCLFAFDGRGDTVCNDIFHFRVHLLVIQMFLSGCVYNGFCHRVREMLFQAGRDAQELIRALCLTEGYDFCYGRLCFRQRTGLVEDDRIGVCNSLQELTALYGNLVLVCFADCGKNRNRHRKL